MRIPVLLFVFLFIISSYVFGDNLGVKTNKYRTISLGNHSYLEIRENNTTGSGEPDYNKILAILSDFEKTNSDKDVVGWKIEGNSGPSARGFIYGIWIDHKPK